ncbi:MAG: DUF4105 domain-containing protein [Bacteriovoracaceae bacterium]|nr:DUF4105 domain-containing protein [Bacteriovoracaceae bacterium]
MKYILILSIFFMIFSANSSKAEVETGFALDTDYNFKNHKNEKKIKYFFHKISSLIAPKLKDKINTTIQISFKDFKDSGELNNVCNISEKNKIIWGETDGKNKILLNRNLLTYIINNNGTDILPCLHGSFHRIATATIIHELAHIYDLNGKDIHSSSTDYKSLTGITRKRLRKRINKNLTRSPDIYEYKNTKEHFAVNLEYFFLDPDYKCRRPLLYSFFQKHFDFIPYPSGKCEINTNIDIIVNGKLQKFKLAPSRIYDIHYLHAGKAKPIMSRFGHSMFRIITCAPNRKEVSEKCLQDTSHHLVAGFVAMIGDISISNLKGLTGKYPVRLTITSLSAKIQEYTRQQLRDLTSVPLNLSKNKIDGFMKHLLSSNWEYKGKYYFLSENCATEAMKILRRVFPEDKTFKKKIRTPVSLYNLLVKKMKLTEFFNDNNKGTLIKNGYYFVSGSEKLSGCYNQLVKSFPDHGLNKNFYKFLKNTDTFTDVSQFVLNGGTNRDLACIIYLGKFESERRAKELLTDTYVSLFDSDSNWKTELKELIEYGNKIQFGGDKIEGYGIPLVNEIKVNANMDDFSKKYQNFQHKVSQKIEDIYPKKHNNLQRINIILEDLKTALLERL